MKSLIAFLMAVTLASCSALSGTHYEMKLNPDGSASWESDSARDAEDLRAEFEKEGDRVYFSLSVGKFVDDSGETTTAIASNLTGLAGEALTVGQIQRGILDGKLEFIDGQVRRVGQ